MFGRQHAGMPTDIVGGSLRTPGLIEKQPVCCKYSDIFTPFQTFFLWEGIHSSTRYTSIQMYSLLHNTRVKLDSHSAQCNNYLPWHYEEKCLTTYLNTWTTRVANCTTTHTFRNAAFSPRQVTMTFLPEIRLFSTNQKFNTGWISEKSSFDFWQGQRVWFFSKPSRLALLSTHPPNQWVPQELFLAAK